MIGALISAGFLAGFGLGWPLIPLLSGAGFLWCFGRQRDWLIASLVVAASIGGAVRGGDSTNYSLSSGWISADRVSGVIASGVVDDGRVQRFRLELGNDRRLCARTFSRIDLGRGDSIDVEIDPDSSVSKGYSAFLRANRCDWSGTVGAVALTRQGSGPLRAIDQLREESARRLVRWIPGDPGALLAGLVVGDDSMLSDDAMDSFQKTGTLHVVAISGSNLTLLVTILLIASAWSVRRSITEIFALLAIWGYVLVGGASPATIRAGALATASAGARALGRPADLLTLSVQVAALQAALWPATVHGLSYLLSTMAILGVLIATAGRKFDGAWGGLRMVLATTLTVNALLMPILPAESRPAVLLSLIANTLIAPIVSVSFVLGLLSVVLAVVHPALGEPLALLGGELNEAIIWIVSGVAGWDWLPGPLLWSGEQAPPVVIWGIAAAVAAAVSVEFRRYIGDLRDHALHVSDRHALLAVGSGAGSIAATVLIALFR
jgi:ComEC/Rec2-related protein